MTKALSDNPAEPPSTASDTVDKDGYDPGSSECDILAPGERGELTNLVARARRSLRDAIPRNTRVAYEGDLKRYAAWCSSAGLLAVPVDPAALVLYMRDLADHGKRYATIERAVAAVCSSEVRAGRISPWGHPGVGDMRTALRRELGVRPRKKRAADDEVLRKLVAVLPGSRLGVRDRSLLTLGWCGALRRSELVAVQVEHVAREPKGLVLLVPESKTDQEHAGEEVPICWANDPEVCPVRSLDAWLAASGIESGYVFRGLGRDDRLASDPLAPTAVYARVRHYAELANLDPDEFGAHSLRSGFVTTAARRGKDFDSIMAVTRHRSERSLREYVQRATIFERAAGEGLLMAGRARPTDEEVAVHEVSHALVVIAAGGTVTGATIVPRGGVEGRTECPHDGLLALRYLADGPCVPPEMSHQVATQEIRAHLAGRAGEELLTGEPHFGAPTSDERADAEWLDDVAERDDDMAGALEAALVIDQRSVVRRLAREYDWTLRFLDMNWWHVEVLVDALLDLRTIYPMLFLPDLPPLRAPT